jgi:hypothetical protein
MTVWRDDDTPLFATSSFIKGGKKAFCQGYLPEETSVMKDGNSWFSRFFAMLVGLDRNRLLFNPRLESNRETIQLLVVNSQPRTIARATVAQNPC